LNSNNFYSIEIQNILIPVIIIKALLVQE
jgi:hypothetical protein